MMGASCWQRYARPEALRQLGSGHNVVESSAGTGKTYLLEHLFVDLLLRRGVPVDAILVVTFTEKATDELLLRIRALLGRLLALSERSSSSTPASATGDDWILDDLAQARLRQALLGFDHANISTIHGFCQRVLHDHAFVQGRFFDEELIAEESTVRACFRDILRTEVAADPCLSPALETWIASGRTVADLEDLIALAHGAGAVETAGTVDEAAVRRAMAAWPASASDPALKRRLQALGVHASTARAVERRLCLVTEAVAAKDVVRYLAFPGPFPNGETLAEALAHLAENLPAAAGDDFAEVAAAVRGLIAVTTSIEAYLVGRLLPLTRRRATERKRRSGTYDFGDMLALVDSALGEASPAGAALLASLRERFRHALIDEFQDTDPVQWSIFRRIFVEARDEHSLTVIGDPKQAIYGFRGADVATYLEATRALLARGAARLDLERNFRSTESMIDAVNTLFDPSGGLFRPGSDIRYTTPARCGRPERALLGSDGTPASPVLVFALECRKESLSADDARDAVQSAIVREIGELLAPTGRLRLEGQPSGRLSARDILVLTFTNAESIAMGRALARAGIPHTFYKLGKLFQSPEARDVLAVLRGVNDPADPGLRLKALLTDFFAVDLVGAAAYRDVGPTAEPARRLFDLAALARRGDVPALFAALLDGGILRRYVFARSGERALTNVMHVLEVLQAEWAARRCQTSELADWLESLIQGHRALPGDEGDLQRLETDEQAVQILTVHKSKGLEADVVFLYGGTGERSGKPIHILHEDGKRILHVGRLSRDAKARADLEKTDEHSRLLYVAMTRSRYRLYLPFYPPEHMRLRGPYRRANDRLAALLGPSLAPPRGFDIVPCTTRAGDRDLRAPEPALDSTFSSAVDSAWSIPPAPPAELDTIRSERAGFEVTSYSAVKRRHGGFVAPGEPALAPGADDTTTREPAGELGRTEVVPGGLPGGAETGIFLHDLLATVSLRDLVESSSFEDWLARPHVLACVGRAVRRHARAEADGPLAARLVHAAYTTAVALPGEPVRLASVRSPLRETEFLFPIPEPGHFPAGVGQPGAAPRWRIERGVVKGIIDLLFEHRGRGFVCDWKSDILPSYDQDTVALHCARNYDIQARLYTVATLRMLGVANASQYQTRFGGMFFCFLRATPPAIHLYRPSWGDIVAVQAEMLGEPFWGRSS